MKKLLTVITMIVLVVSCAGNKQNSNEATESEKDRVEIIYFHGAQRCATCKAMEKGAREVIEKSFLSEFRKGKVIFRIVDITAPEGEKLADNYEVAWSSLFVTRWKDGKETRNDMTKFGFANARKNPDFFKNKLTETIRQALE